MYAKEMSEKSSDLVNYSIFYGRSEESLKLRKAYERVEQGNYEIVFIRGYSGTGKTTLAKQVIHNIISEEVYYVSGKFDQVNRNEPYKPFVQAFRTLIKVILTEPKASVETWKKKLKAVLGKNGGAITEIIPEIDLIIGKQSLSKNLDPQKAKKGFERIFIHFIQAFATKEHPLVLFIDDLQWADEASVELFQQLIDEQSHKYMLLIGAYREEEIYEKHPFFDVLQSIDKKNESIKTLHLRNFNFDATEGILKAFFKEPILDRLSLTEVIYKKTLGNPFYIMQLLQLMLEKNYIILTKKEGCWQWKSQLINNIQTDIGVVKFLINKLNRIPKKPKELIKFLSCLGNSFDLDTLLMISQLGDKNEVTDDLDILINEGLIVSKKTLHSINYEFIHDRVQQAACDLMDLQERKEIHLIIGQSLLQHIQPEELEKRLVSVMPHFTFSIELVEDTKERLLLSKYYLIAGKKAKTTAAFQEALQFLETGLGLLSFDSWQVDYDLTYELHFQLSQCEYVCKHFTKAEDLFEQLLAHAKTDTQKSEIHSQIAVYRSLIGDYAKAINHGVIALKYIGCHLSEEAGSWHILSEILLSLWLFRNRRINKLTTLKEVDAKNIKASLEILTVITPSANITDPRLFLLVILKLANISAIHGNTKNASIGYAGYAFFTANIIGNLKKANAIGRSALNLSEVYDDTAAKSVVHLALGTFVIYWTQHCKIAIQYAKSAFSFGLESGEYLFAGYSITSIVEMSLSIGINLEQLKEDCEYYLEFARDKGFSTVLNSINMIKEVITYLEGDKKYINNFMDEGFENELILQEKNEIVNYYLYKAETAYLLGDNELALENIENAFKYIQAVTGYYFATEIFFYYALIITAQYKGSSCKVQKKHRRLLKKIKNKLKKWAENCQDNFLHKYLLIEAEIARLSDQNIKAMNYYDQSIETAEKYGYMQNKALANELAGRYYLAKEKYKIAGVYLHDAIKHYTDWGANAKAIMLLHQYHMFIKHKFESIRNNEEKDLNDIHLSESIKMEFAASLHELDNIMNEPHIKQRDKMLLELILKFTRADKGYIFRESDEILQIDAVIDPEYISQSTCEHLDEVQTVSKKVIRYVARTYEPVFLIKDQNWGVFSNDTYLINNQPGAVVCMPLLHDNIFAGVIYLQHNTKAENFTSHKMKFVKIVSSHICYLKKMQSYNHYTKGTVNFEEMPVPLTERESEVLALIALGKSNKDIAQTLLVSVSTVKTHVLNIYGKLGVNKRIQAVMKAKELGLINQ
ncbi:helix-turn-helix transcriptional regulator [Vallitalea okinawensis]|uniref:helix-turn-helix transcriptional regulator n=1 Tax=Vallitalea okinawensis TaxID=2078660 RepID=UPI001478E0CF|nr:AAA family ATPase [Vallitalea okinawensis]